MEDIQEERITWTKVSMHYEAVCYVWETVISDFFGSKTHGD
jgi:hypothetical protein